MSGLYKCSLFKFNRLYVQPYQKILRSSNTEDQTWKKKRRKSEWGVKLPLLNIPMRSEADVDNSNNFRPHSLWLTRGKTEYEAAQKSKEQPLRRAYLQLDELKPGDVFGVEGLVAKYVAKVGLDHMQPALASEAQGVSLLSNGAEVIKISKRFFLAHAANNTMLKVETMYKEYVSENEAQDMLFEKETWDQYRSALWQRMTQNMKPKGVHNRLAGPQSART